MGRVQPTKGSETTSIAGDSNRTRRGISKKGAAMAQNDTKAPTPAQYENSAIFRRCCLRSA